MIGSENNGTEYIQENMVVKFLQRTSPGLGIHLGIVDGCL